MYSTNLPKPCITNICTNKGQAITLLVHTRPAPLSYVLVPIKARLCNKQSSNNAFHIRMSHVTIQW